MTQCGVSEQNHPSEESGFAWKWPGPRTPTTLSLVGHTLDTPSEDPLEQEMATYTSILAWTISWTEEPCGYRA